MTTMPAEITYGHVTGRFIAAWTDGPDAGRTPGPRPLEGLTVKITPKVQTRRLAGSAPVLVATMPVTCKVDADGRLIDEQGNPGVWLVTGVYGVTYSHPAVSIPAHDIEVTDTHTEAAPLDLVTAMPPGGPVLTASQYAELSARIDALGTGGGGTGTQGPPGEDGTDGADGASAYEVAVAAGFAGTESEWLASLVGPAGADGADGAPGPKGDKGDPGEDGAPGAPGADGADGVGIPQTLSLTGTNLTLSDGGGTVTLPSGGGGGGEAQPLPGIRPWEWRHTLAGWDGSDTDLPYGYISAVPIWLDAGNYQTAAIQVRSGGGPATLVRLGIYDLDENLIGDFGTAVANGESEVNISATVTVPTTGWHLAAAVIQGTDSPVQVQRGLPILGVVPGTDAGTRHSPGGRLRYTTRTYLGALPSSLAGDSRQQRNFPISLAFRRSPA